MKAYFDCRQFVKGVERKNRRLVGETERININFQVPEEDVALWEGFAKRVESIEGDRFYVNAKIFPNAKWFDRFGSIAKPDNASLDGKGWEVNIKTSIKHGKDKLDSNGVYVNGIQLLSEDAPFQFEERVQDGARVRTPMPKASESDNSQLPDELPF